MTTFLGSSASFTVAGSTFTYNLNTSNAAAGVWTVQNVTPTFAQAKAGSVNDNEVQPFAEVAYSDWTGGIGLYQRTDDPGDFTRPFISNLDTSKAGQVTGGATTKTSTASISGAGLDTSSAICAWVDSQLGPGFVAKKNASATYAYWRWNESAFTWDYQRDVYNPPSTGNGSATCRAMTGAMHAPYQQITQYYNALYMATTTGTAGLTDISIAAAAPAGATAIAGCCYTVKHYDQLVTFSVLNGNLSVVCLNGSPLVVTQSIGADGTLSNNTATIYGETNIMGAVALNGVLFVFTDKSLYALQWIEATKVFVIEPIIVGNGKFTSNPAVFSNELYIGSDNQLWHWTPGQGNNDFKQIDAGGWLPSPYNGRITELHPFMQVLVVKVVIASGVAGANDAALLRFTSLGAWQHLANIANQTNSAMGFFSIRTQDGTNLPTIHTPISISAMLSSAVFESGQNVRSLAPGSVTTLAGVMVTPWEYGNNRTAQKQLLRSRWEVENTNSSSLLGFYQTDNNDKAANSPTFAGAGVDALGTWKAASPTMLGSTTGDASSALNSTGTGILWSEYDGSNGADWHGSTAYPTYKRIRWLYQITAASAAAPPALLSHAWQRLEYAFKFYVINTVLKLEIGMDHPNNPGSAITDSTTLMTEVNRIQGWDYGKSIITVVGPDGNSYPAVITKFLSNVSVIDPNGPRQVTIALTLQVVKLFGLAI